MGTSVRGFEFGHLRWGFALVLGCFHWPWVHLHYSYGWCSWYSSPLRPFESCESYTRKTCSVSEDPSKEDLVSIRILLCAEVLVQQRMVPRWSQRIRESREQREDWDVDELPWLFFISRLYIDFTQPLQAMSAAVLAIEMGCASATELQQQIDHVSCVRVSGTEHVRISTWWCFEGFPGYAAAFVSFVGICKTCSWLVESH